ncbi:MAG TPA: anthranilate phosphoribosyltransferase [Kiloniellales bacterium]|nr:anthranilate phosphoribosyltransferase [Kiloniellales bacterium]
MPADMPDLKALLALVAEGESLAEADAQRAFDIMMAGDATPSQMGGLLMALRVRGETVPEITGAARAMRSRMTAIEAPPGAIDTCGTGGDAKGSFNISSTAAFVIAACGLPVAKHGNRALSSKSGAADVLTALGVNVDADMPLVRRALWEVGTCFLMAPRHHSAMRHVGPTRVELGTRTIFNLLGPLCSPANVKHQLMGVYDKVWLEPLAMALGELGHERAWIVHGEQGFDEITTAGTTYVAEWKDGTLRRFEITPEQVGLPRCRPEDLLGGDGEQNARTLRAILAGEEGPLRDTVVLTSAAALVIGNKAEDLRDGVEQAARAIDEGRATEVLDKLVAITNEEAEA